jgi:hypothetical protein
MSHTSYPAWFDHLHIWCSVASPLFIHLVVCLTTGPKPLRKRALHIVRSRASSFKWEYPLFSLRSSSSFLRLLPCLPVTPIPPCIFPSVTRCRMQFLRKTWPVQFAFRLRISCRIFLCSLTLSNTTTRQKNLFGQHSCLLLWQQRLPLQNAFLKTVVLTKFSLLCSVWNTARCLFETVSLLKILIRLSTSVAVMCKARLNLGCSYIDIIIFSQPREVCLFVCFVVL